MKEDLVTLREAAPELFDEVASMRTQIEELLRRIGSPNCRMIPFMVTANITTGVRLVAINTDRRSLVFFNNSGASVTLHNAKLNANDVGRWIILTSGGYYEPPVASVDEWYVLGTTGAQEVFGYEGI